MTPWDFEIGIASHPGRKRSGKPNQDAVEIILPDVERKHPPLLILADGMGGYAGGEVASRLVIETIRDLYRQSEVSNDYSAFFVGCLQKAHEALRSHSAQNPQMADMGSTVVLALLDEEQIVTANVGDSRAYLFHDGEILQLSHDHSVVAEQVRTGLITPLQARRHPKRNRLTQSLSARRQEIHPYVNRSLLKPGDIVLLCSDGLWGVVSEAIIQAVAIELSPQDAANKLVTLANASQGPDNVSVIIARRAGDRDESKIASFLDDTNPGEVLALV